jgi:hypothetical protein
MICNAKCLRNTGVLQMQARINDQHAIVKKALEVNTSVLLELSTWKPKVQANVEELQSSVRNLCEKIKHLSSKQEEMVNPAYKVFDTQHLDFSESAAAHLAGKPIGVTSGPIGHNDEHNHQGVGNGVVTTYVPTLITGAKHPTHLSPVVFASSGFYASDAVQF